MFTLAQPVERHTYGSTLVITHSRRKGAVEVVCMVWVIIHYCRYVVTHTRTHCIYAVFIVKFHQEYRRSIHPVTFDKRGGIQVHLYLGANAVVLKVPGSSTHCKIVETPLRHRDKGRIHGIEVEHTVITAVAYIQRNGHAYREATATHRVATREERLVVRRIRVASKTCIVAGFHLLGTVKEI